MDKEGARSEVKHPGLQPTPLWMVALHVAAWPFTVPQSWPQAVFQHMYVRWSDQDTSISHSLSFVFGAYQLISPITVSHCLCTVLCILSHLPALVIRLISRPPHLCSHPYKPLVTTVWTSDLLKLPREKVHMCLSESELLHFINAKENFESPRSQRDIIPKLNTFISSTDPSFKVRVGSHLKISWWWNFVSLTKHHLIVQESLSSEHSERNK